MTQRTYDGRYRGAQLDRVAYPLGGMGAGMICLEGNGGLAYASLRHRPNMFSQPMMFGAVCIKGATNAARLIEGPTPGWKIMHPWSHALGQNSGNGGQGLTYGLPRFAEATFAARFPFGTCELHDDALPLSAKVTGWSPFLPGEADDSSLPAAALEYTITNTSDAAVESVFSFHVDNIMRFADWGELPREQQPRRRVRPIVGGLVVEQEGCDAKPWAQGSLAVTTDAPACKVDCRWFRGGWFDALTMVWRNIADGTAIEQSPPDDEPSSPGGSLYVPIALAAGESQTIRVRLSWYVPQSDLREGGRACDDAEGETSGWYRPWYASRFDSVDAVAAYWDEHYDRLRAGTHRFTDCFYDTTLPAEVIDAVASNLAILKSPTVLRQADGRLWAWEGCCDDRGCCAGSCTHVWNYAQALPHLFPELERTLRETEYGDNQAEDGHQTFRAALPIRPTDHRFHAAADGQLGGIMKMHREWRISGDLGWLTQLWPSVRQSLDYCIEQWDPKREGALREPHHNTYDIEFWGPDGMCNSFYVGALQAAVRMGEAVGEDVSVYASLLDKARAFQEGELYDGEYFVQRIEWRGLRAGDPAAQAKQGLNLSYASEARALLEKEGPKYQYGRGCLSDGILGDWLARACDVPTAIDGEKVASHLAAVVKHNFRDDLSQHPNPQRPTYALGREAGLLLCSWPKGGEPSLPFVYSNEVWTGIEYHVASHLMMTGQVDAARRIVRAVRDRYDGRRRNPFNEYECGHWYARAMSSYGLLQGMTGQCYDAVEQVLTLRPQVAGDFRSFLCTATGYGTVGVRDGEPFLEVRRGEIACRRIEVLDAVPAGRG
ncbi:MAG: GH116 family glycosyl hydrolase [Phycisphaeraceae bacterium]